MPKVLIVYYSRSGNTEAMAKLVAEGVELEGVEVECKKVADTSVDDLLAADGIILGSPTYYGTMAAEIKKLLDDSVRYHGKLDGKVGAGPKAKQPQPFSGLQVGFAQGAVADDTGTQQWGGIPVGDGVRQRQGIVGFGKQIFRVPAIHMESGEFRLGAQVLHACLAVLACAAGRI